MFYLFCYRRKFYRRNKSSNNLPIQQIIHQIFTPLLIIFLIQCPSRCCSFRKFFLILYCRAVETTVKADILKVFFSPHKEIWQFQLTTGLRITLFTCVDMWQVHYLCIYPILFKCGVVSYRLCCQGFVRTSLWIGEMCCSIAFFIQFEQNI